MPGLPLELEHRPEVSKQATQKSASAAGAEPTEGNPHPLKKNPLPFLLATLPVFSVSPSAQEASSGLACLLSEVRGRSCSGPGPRLAPVVKPGQQMQDWQNSGTVHRQACGVVQRRRKGPRYSFCYLLICSAKINFLEQEIPFPRLEVAVCEHAHIARMCTSMCAHIFAQFYVTLCATHL